MSDDRISRDELRRDIHREYRYFYSIGGGLVLIAIGVWLGALIFRTGYYTNVYTELLSVIATIVVLDRLNDWRDMRRLRGRLQREASSRDNSTALNAVDWLRAEGWLTCDDNECLLARKKMARANLENAYLYGANLERVNFYKTNLSKADLSMSNLYRAYLHRANLSNASVYGTDFRGTVLWMCNLRNVKHIDQAQFDEGTVLPDARPLYDAEGNIQYDAYHRVLFDRHWTPETDMTRYTNPAHRDYWSIE